MNTRHECTLTVSVRLLQLLYQHNTVTQLVYHKNHCQCLYILKLKIININEVTRYHINHIHHSIELSIKFIL